MTVFKAMVRIFTSYWGSTLIYLVIFIGFGAVLIGRPESETNQAFESESLRIVLADDSQSELSYGFESYLSSNHQVENRSGEAIEDLRTDLFTAKYAALIHIPEDFEERVFQGANEQLFVQTNQRDMAAPQIISEVDSYFRLLNAFITAGESNPEALSSRINQTLSHEADIAFVTNNRSSEVAEAYKVGITLLGFIMMQLIMGVVGMTMASLKRDNIQRRISTSGYSLMDYNKEVILGQLSFGAVIFPIIMIMLYLYIPGSVEIDYLRVGISIALFILVNLSLTFLITMITTNRTILSAITLVTSLGLAFVSGIFIPYEILGSFMQRLAYFSPLFYYRQSIMKNITSYADLWAEWGIMAVFCLVFILLGAAVSRQKQFNRS